MMNKKDFYRLFGVNDYPTSFESEEDRERIKFEVRERINASIEKQNIAKVLNRGTYFFLKVAAAMVIMISLVFGIYNFRKSNQTEEYLTLTNPKGKIIELKLSEGSKIWLNAGTTIRYPKKFRNTRDIYLDEGEAFFDVTHNPQKPFIVHSGNIHTQVIGTAFSVKAYKTASSINVSVVRGRVSVGTSSTLFGVITRNEQITFDKSSQRASKNYINADDLCAWRRGEIILKGASFAEIVFSIENAYDVKFKYDYNTFHNCQNSIRFNSKQSLIDILELLKEIQGINYTINGKNIMITGKKCT